MDNNGNRQFNFLITLCILCFLFISPYSHAGNAYIGINAGVDSGFVDLQTAFVNALGQQIDLNLNLKPADTCGATGAYLGYEWLFANKFYFAPELSAEYSQFAPGIELEFKLNSGQFFDPRVITRIYYTFGLGFNFGYKLKDDLLIRTRLGLLVDFAELEAGIQDTPGTTIKKRTPLAGGTIGLALEHYLTKHVSIGTEYNLIFYPNVRFTGKLHDKDLPNAKFGARITALLNEYDVRLIYHF